jgi:hypothetical protein
MTLVGPNQAWHRRNLSATSVPWSLFYNCNCSRRYRTMAWLVHHTDFLSCCGRGLSGDKKDQGEYHPSFWWIKGANITKCYSNLGWPLVGWKASSKFYHYIAILWCVQPVFKLCQLFYASNVLYLSCNIWKKYLDWSNSLTKKYFQHCKNEK